MRRSKAPAIACCGWKRRWRARAWICAVRHRFGPGGSDGRGKRGLCGWGRASRGQAETPAGAPRWRRQRSMGPSSRRLGSHVVETKGKALVEVIRGIPKPRHLCFEEGTQSARSSIRSARASTDSLAHVRQPLDADRGRPDVEEGLGDRRQPRAAPRHGPEQPRVPPAGPGDRQQQNQRLRGARAVQGGWPTVHVRCGLLQGLLPEDRPEDGHRRLRHRLSAPPKRCCTETAPPCFRSLARKAAHRLKVSPTPLDGFESRPLR